MKSLSNNGVKYVVLKNDKVIFRWLTGFLWEFSMLLIVGDIHEHSFERPRVLMLLQINWKHINIAIFSTKIASENNMLFCFQLSST